MWAAVEDAAEKGLVELEPGSNVYRNDEYFRKVNNDPALKQMIKLKLMSVRLSRMNEHYRKMESTAEAAKTRALKAEREKRAAATASIVVPAPQQDIFIGNNRIHNPYFSKLSLRRMSTGQEILFKVSCPVFQFQFARGSIYPKWLDDVTKVVERNGLSWTYAYGYKVYKKKTYLTDREKTPIRRTGFILLTRGDKFAMTNNHVYNVKGQLEMSKFLALSDADKDKFVQGQI